MRVDIFKVDTHRVLFWLDYVGAIMIVEFDYRMQIGQSRRTIKDPEHRILGHNLAR